MARWRLGGNPPERAFDHHFYKANSPELTGSRKDLWRHFCEIGWRQHLDPNANFSVFMYLVEHKDVAEVGMNPYLHYYEYGIAEGRTVRPSGWRPAPAKEVVHGLEQMREEFDPVFYVRSNRDVAEAGVDPFQHFIDHGWREGRDPSTEFSMKGYLTANPDVAAAGVNPFAHYLLHGRAEGRFVGEGISFIDAVLSAQPLEIPHVEPDYLPEPFAPLTRQLLAENQQSVCISFGNDDFTSVVGGVQICVRLELDNCRKRDQRHIYVYPRWFMRRLQPRANYEVNVVIDGEEYFTCTIEELKSALAPVLSKTEVISIHGLLGHNPAAVTKVLLPFAKRARPDFWVHDYFSTCSNYNLTLNGIRDCGPAPVGSTACMVCTYGQGRLEHRTEVQNMITALNAKLITPSQAAADIYYSASGRKVDEVRPHGVAQFNGSRTLGVDRTRVAFVGQPVFHKGWEHFQMLKKQLLKHEDLDFLVFSSDDVSSTDEWILTKPEGSVASTTALLQENQIDVVIMWPNWHETFSLVTLEAIAAGCMILTHSQSGNVVNLAREHNRLIEYNSFTELLAAARDGSLYTHLRSLAGKELETGEFIWTGLNCQLAVVDK